MDRGLEVFGYPLPWSYNPGRLKSKRGMVGEANQPAGVLRPRRQQSRMQPKDLIFLFVCHFETQCINYPQMVIHFGCLIIHICMFNWHMDYIYLWISEVP